MEELMTEGANLVYDNKVIDGTAIKQLISRLIDHFGMSHTAHILDQVKKLGFQQATSTSISLGIDDLLTIPSKRWLVKDIEKQELLLEKPGNAHAVEKLRQSIEVWYTTSEYLQQEMNPNFRMTEPFNPVHIMSFSGARGNVSQVHQLIGMRGLILDPQGQMMDLPIQSNFREGLSLTEYIISCYGARKGVVDTAIRTADAGYLTRRLVEVVQHVVVRRTDCGTVRGIPVNPQDGMMPAEMLIQTLIGRVLADDIYIGPRCIAIRNQDIGPGLVNRFITFRTQLISIRTPFTCRSTSWICRLCYGWSTADGNLVELGEAVGILAGQSIGEPGTQLTLRTFHTGGVFTGGTADYVRAPYNGKIKFNEDLVHPTRTRHGHPAFLCYIDVCATIENEGILHNVTIPSESIILVKNDQYVKSEQVIAELRAGIDIFNNNNKDRVQKYVYSDSEGEMHWSTDMYHAPELKYSNVHRLKKTNLLWILSGGSRRSSVISFSLHKDQDQMNIHSLSVEGRYRYISSLSVNNVVKNNQVRHKFFSSDLPGKKESGIPDDSKFNRIIYTGHCNLIYPAILHKNSDLVAKRRRNRFIVPVQSIQEREKELMPASSISIEIPLNGIFCRNSIFAYFDDPQYRKHSSGILKYGDIGDLVEYRGVKEFKPKYQTKVDRFIFIPEEVHIFPESSSIMVRNNSLIGVDTRITLNTRSRVGGLVRLERKKEKIELKIFSGDIHFPGKTDTISRHNDIWIPPGTVKKNSKESKKFKNGIYVQRIARIKKKKKYLVLVRPVSIYERANGINLEKLFPQDMLQERDNPQLRVVNYILYVKGKAIREISDTSIQLVRTCLVLNWDQDKKSPSIEEAEASFVEVGTNGLIRNFLRIDLVKSSISYIRKRNDPSGSGRISDNGSDRTNINPFYSTYSKARVQQSLRQNQRTISTLLNRNKECQSLIILSSLNCFRLGPFNNVKYHNVIKELIKKDSRIPIRNSLGPLGAVLQIANFYSFCHLITHNQISVSKYLQLGNLKQIFKVLKYYLIDENGRIYNPDSCSNIILNPFNLNWYFLDHDYCEERSTIINLGQFFCENVCIAKNVPRLKSGQVIIVQADSVVIRSAKPYLLTGGTTVHGPYGEILYEGDTLYSYIYEKPRSSDITQGLPKVERVLEARSFDSISMNLEKRVAGWDEYIRGIFGIPWGFLISTEITIAQSRISLVNKIQKIYRSQGVQIHNKHIELIVHQITSKVVVSEDGISNAFLPGELIGLLRAERMGRALEEAIFYRNILLGITRTSLNTQSFISEASFQETARVLAKAALRGRIDWLKGLKENIVLGSMIPAGTGFKGLVHFSRKHDNIPLKTQNLFESEMRDILFHHIDLFDSCISKSFHDTSEQSFIEFNDS